MRLYKFFAFLLITLSLSIAVSAQTDDEINIDASIVRLNVGAVSRSGSPVKNLTKENFSIYRRRRKTGNYAIRADDRAVQSGDDSRYERFDARIPADNRDVGLSFC